MSQTPQRVAALKESVDVIDTRKTILYTGASGSIKTFAGRVGDIHTCGIQFPYFYQLQADIYVASIALSAFNINFGVSRPYMDFMHPGIAVSAVWINDAALINGDAGRGMNN